MKKLFAAKIAVLGAIGVMTLAGAGSALAAGNANENKTIRHMSEYDATSEIEAAKNQSEEVVVDDNGDLVMKQGGTFYVYHFQVTGEEDTPMYACKTKEEAQKFAQERCLNNVHYDRAMECGGPVAVSGTTTYGDLTITCTQVVQNHSADAAVMGSAERIIID